MNKQNLFFIYTIAIFLFLVFILARHKQQLDFRERAHKEAINLIKNDTIDFRRKEIEDSLFLIYNK